MKGAYKKLNLTHLEVALPQVLDLARGEQWTYETFLERALAAELEGREQKATVRRLKAARFPSPQDVGCL
jgi:DNA replication protein DnaC